MTDTGMVEKVARRIYENRNGHGCRAWGTLPNSHKEPYFGDARAAIAAMEVPTPSMLNVGAEMHHLRDQCQFSRHATVGEIHRAMIQAALKEQG